MEPIALLLQEVARTFKKGSEDMGPWVRIVQLEETLVDRARAAFLGDWYGDRLPIERLDLQITITNIDALRARHDEVRAAEVRRRRAAEGPNLLEPLLGTTGTLAGAVLGAAINPIGLGAGIALLIKRKARAVAYLGWIGLGVLGPAVLGLVLGIGTPAGLLASGAVLDRSRDTLQLGRAVADAIGAFNAFVGQIMGKREDVKNPLVRALLDVFDGLAGVMSHVLAMYSLLVTRVAPLALPLVDQMLAFGDLARATFTTIGLLVDEIKAAFARVADWRGLPLTRVLLALAGPLRGVGGMFKDLFGELKAIFRHLGGQLGVALAAVIKAVKHEFAALVTPASMKRHPAGELIADIISRVSIMKPALVTLTTSTGPPGFASKALGKAYDAAKWSVEKVAKLKGGPPPTPRLAFPDAARIEALVGGRPDFLRTRTEVREANLASLDAEGNEVLESRAVEVELPGPSLGEQAAERFPTNDPQLRMLAGLMTQDEYEETLRRQMSLAESPLPMLQVFSGRAAALRRDHAAAGRMLAGREQELRAHLSLVVGRILPPAARTYVHELFTAFSKVDEHVYGVPAGRSAWRPRGEDELYPVRDLPDNGRLRLVVRRVTVAAEGASEATLRAFADKLLARLRAQDYPADPLPGGGP